MGGLDQPKSPERTPPLSFTLSDTEEITLATNGLAVLRYRKMNSAQAGDILRVSGEKTYEVEVTKVEQSPAPGNNPSSVPDGDFFVRLVSEIQKAE